MQPSEEKSGSGSSIQGLGLPAEKEENGAQLTSQHKGSQQTSSRLVISGGRVQGV